MICQTTLVDRALDVFRRADTPISLSCYLRYKYLGFLAEMPSIDPSHYADAQSFAIDWQCVNLLRKFQPEEKLPIAEKAAMEKWFGAEKRCYRSNVALSTVGFGVHLEGARRIISNALPPLTRSVTAAILNGCNLGPGASVGARGRDSRPHFKVANTLTMTRDVMFLIPMITEHQLIRAARENGGFEVVGGNELVLVPKSIDEDRPIAIEPTVNLYLQLGVGSYIRQRLRRFGIDLNAGQQRHGELTLAASAVGDLATVDLSSASDTISRDLVKSLLPRDWFILLDAIRSRRTKVDGRYIELEKFSSMGNGFTFELETLIFYALCKAESAFCSVYGDDIIIPAADYDRVREKLELVGLVVNEDKSFAAGPFRESCGTDAFDGHLVTPYRLKKNITDVIGAIEAANAIFFAIRRNPFLGFLRPLRSWLISQIPRKYRLYGPDFEPLAIHDYDDSRFIYRWIDQKKQVKVVRASWPQVALTGHHRVVITCALYGLSPRYIPRGVKPKCRVRWVTPYGVITS